MSEPLEPRAADAPWFTARQKAISRGRFLRDEIARLRNEQFHAERKCGSCALWRTRGCPFERNVNGRKSGPLSEDVKCGKWMPSAGHLERATANRARIAEMTAELHEARRDA